MSSARAIDIPMNRDLAMERLDSKTCYGTVMSGGRLAGYELAMGLLVSSSGKLVELQPVRGISTSTGKPRRYIGDGIEIEITPQKVMNHEDQEEPLSIVLEEGFIIVNDNGRRQRLPVKVREICTS
jgi:hypothetical protein